MSIEGIGKRGGVVSEAPATETPTASGSSFEVAATDAAVGPLQVGGGGEAFAALERGEISAQQYLDAQVESALAPLLAQLSSERLDFVRAELRSALETDPVLLELVRKSTGGASGGG